jgi:hypothetical protein
MLKGKLAKIKDVSVKSEIIALAFGMLLILETFGDAPLMWFIGNLDTIFGLSFWQFLDIFYPIASIAVFLLYGKAKGGIKINKLTIGLVASYIFALMLMSLDDIILVLNLPIILPKSYWVIIQWFYPVYSIIAFFLFGRANQRKNPPQIPPE